VIDAAADLATFLEHKLAATAVERDCVVGARLLAAVFPMRRGVAVVVAGIDRELLSTPFAAVSRRQVNACSPARHAAEETTGAPLIRGKV
jgi:hypothetical protein